MNLKSYSVIFFAFAFCAHHQAISQIDATNYNPSIPDDYRSIADITNYQKWGPYNVHDPSCIKVGDEYYLYSTDAVYRPRGGGRRTNSVQVGNIQVRQSKDLVHWNFVGWAFNTIPEEAIEHVRKYSGGRGASNIWAPFVMKWKNEFRLYYAVSAFGMKTSYLGLAAGPSPTGPWKQIGCVVKTTSDDVMNAIDPTVVADVANDKLWMIYGSFFGGIYCVQLNPQTGLTLLPDDKGHCVARRADSKTHNIEAPEVVYNPSLRKYFLFLSYDDLFTWYNVRVGRSDKPEGPYYDFFGKDMSEPENNYPVLTHAYRFNNHPGWAGVAHCGVLNDNGQYFMFHQGRLAPDNQMMVLHVRRIFWTPDGWPVVSPERYAALPQPVITSTNMEGNWEIIQLTEVNRRPDLWTARPGAAGWQYDTTKFNNSKVVQCLPDGKITDMPNSTWRYNDNHLYLIDAKENRTTDLLVSREWDWENSVPTIVFTGLDRSGFSMWGKKTK